MNPRLDAVAFDLGNTLVEYYRPERFPAVLQECVTAVHGLLTERGATGLPLETVRARAMQQNREPSDYRVHPLPERLAALFEVPAARREKALFDEASLRFLRPIWDLAHVYQDTVRVLRRLRSEGYRTGIISNLPWGSPPALWREEVGRLGVAGEVDEVVFCGDAGYRKPAPEVFGFALARLGVEPRRCAFVGDHPEWDYDGARDAGMRPFLIDRDDVLRDFPGERVLNLDDLLARLAAR
jgi:putative hydrolase of the HAD superfamily